MRMQHIQRTKKSECFDFKADLLMGVNDMEISTNSVIFVELISSKGIHYLQTVGHGNDSTNGVTYVLKLKLLAKTRKPLYRLMRQLSSAVLKLPCTIRDVNEYFK